ncbi:MAG: hypothetical protein AB4063_07615 [Crocosphaera sp.]
MLRYSPFGVLLSCAVLYFGLQGMVKQFSPSPSPVTQPSNSVEQIDNVRVNG